MERLIIVHHTDWLLYLLVGAFVLLLASRLYNPARFKAFVFLPFHANRAELEADFRPVVGRGFFDISLGVVSFLMLGLALFFLLHPYNGYPPVLSDWQLYLRLLSALLFFFVLKNFIGLLVGWVFSQSEFIASAQNVSFAHRSWLGLVVFPILFLMTYFVQAYQVFYYLLFVVLAVGYYLSLQFYILRFWRLNALSYYKIFYLCALEITPFVFLVIWLQSLYR